MRTQNGNRYLQIDKYQIDLTKKLGDGSCGSVYLGYYFDRSTTNEKTLLAIKEIMISAKFEVKNTLLQEINIMRRLNHPNIVRFIDAKKTDQNMYLIMEFCNEGSLEDMIMENEDMSEAEVMKCFRQIVRAFQFLHKHKVLHRDIKPANILIHNGVCKLADFGLAKIVDERNQNLTFNKGTPLFMSPQILKQELYTDKSDVWSLGVTLYFMLFKEFPWNERNPVQLLNTICKKIESGKLMPEGKHVSDGVANLLQHMLVIDEAKRFSWEELFHHEVVNIQNDNEEFQMSIAKSTETIEEVTKNSFEVKNQDDYEGKQIDMALNAYMIQSNYIRHHEGVYRGRIARDLLEFEIEKAEFLQKVGKQLEEQKKVRPDLADDLFVRCMFLIIKRCYIIFLDLYQMLSFQTNQQGVIEINKEYWREFIDKDEWNGELNRIRKKIEGGYNFLTKEFARRREIFVEAQRTYAVFNLIDRGDAFNDCFVESEFLIQAFNDNILELFNFLAGDIVKLRQDNRGKIYPNNIYWRERKIDLFFVYDLLIVLSFRNSVKFSEDDNYNKFQKYYEQRASIDLHEIAYRIELMYYEWNKKQQSPEKKTSN